MKNSSNDHISGRIANDHRIAQEARSLREARSENRKTRGDQRHPHHIPTKLNENAQRRPFHILALDGGGVHGAATTAFLACIEDHVQQPIHCYFDLIAGTSTGGLIGLALSRNIPAAEIEALYLDRGPRLFKRRFPYLPRKVAAALGPLYRSAPLHEEIRSTLGEETLLGDAKCRVCVPAVNITSGEPVVFKTRHHEEYERDYRYKMWKVAAATSAAPGYFRPVEIPGAGWFVDGGLWANSPVDVGIAEAIKLGYDLRDIRVLSIGTGNSTYHRNGAPHRVFGQLRNGVLGWSLDLIGLMMRSQTRRAENLCSYLLPKEELVRIDFPLPPDAGGLDAVGEVEIFATRAREEAKRSGRYIRESFFKAVAPPFEPLPHVSVC